MSNVRNEARIKNPLIVAIREQLEHRALWMYLLCDEAKKKGLAPEEYARGDPPLRTVSGRESAREGRRRRIAEGPEEDALLQIRAVGLRDGRPAL